MQKRTALAGVLAISAVVAGFATGASAADKKFIVGVSNTLIGNGWRLIRNQTPAGAVVEWRCPRCWVAYKATQSAKGTT